MSARERLADLGLELPPPPAPAAAYVPHTRVGDIVVTAGQLPLVAGTLVATGRVGDDVTLEQAQDAARIAALNLLAVAADAADGDLDRVRVVKLTVFVSSADDFVEQHLVANGASLLLAEVLGDDGIHARSAVGVPRLPLDAPVEVEAMLALS